MPLGPGFYYNNGDGLTVQYAPNGVSGPGFSIQVVNQSTYTYPVNGWTYYPDEDTARAAFSLPSSAIANLAEGLMAKFPGQTLAGYIATATTILANNPNFVL